MILDKSYIVRRITERMKELKISKVELGRVIGSRASRPQNLILAANRVLNPKNPRINLEEIKSIADLLGVKVDYFFGEPLAERPEGSPFTVIREQLYQAGMDDEYVDVTLRQLRAVKAAQDIEASL